MTFARGFACAALIALFSLASAAAARAADDGSAWNSVMGFFGHEHRDGDEKIDFRERPKLVLPPNPQSLPEPRQAYAARPASWPTDKGDAHRTGPRVAQGGVDGEPKRENLTQPPEGYRRPTKDMSNWKDPDARPGFNPLGYVGSLTKSIGLGGE